MYRMSMPRLSEKTELLEGIQTAIESTACAYLLASSSEEDRAEGDAGGLLIVREAVDSHRCLSRRGSAGCHGAGAGSGAGAGAGTDSLELRVVLSISVYLG